MAFDTHRIFNGAAKSPDYIKRLTLEARTEAVLRKARDEIRETLRGGLRNWSTLVSKRDLFDAALQSVEPPALRPKFRMQGSFSYRTCNVPAQQPPQETDLDDGLFLPVSFLSQNGNAHPAVVSDGLFLAVERILEPLCSKRGWRLNKQKSSCVRVELPGHAHIDLALYAIPDREFEELLEMAAQSSGVVLADAYEELRRSREMTDEVYRELSGDQIMLAHREEGWKPSDPRKLEDWFQAAIDVHGEQLRRVCRYLKGWRDHQWDACGLASIALMSAVITAYEEAQEKLPAFRDDLGVLMVAERLPELLSGVIANPVVEGQRLDEGWTVEQRAEFVRKAQDLAGHLQHAMTAAEEPEDALASLITAFGSRIPNDPELIVVEQMGAPSQKSAPAVLRSALRDIAATATVAALSEAEQYRRAEAAVREAQNRGDTSKPWSQ